MKHGLNFVLVVTEDGWRAVNKDITWGCTFMTCQQSVPEIGIYKGYTEDIDATKDDNVINYNKLNNTFTR